MKNSNSLQQYRALVYTLIRVSQYHYQLWMEEVHLFLISHVIGEVATWVFDSVVSPSQKAPLYEGVGSISGIFKIYVCVSLD